MAVIRESRLNTADLGPIGYDRLRDQDGSVAEYIKTKLPQTPITVQRNAIRTQR